MENRIQSQTILEGQIVKLIPLKESHFPELEALATDKRIWEFYPLNGGDPQKFRSALETALTERANGNQFPFVIFHKTENRIIGSTRYLDIQPKHKKLEIGWTWLHPDYWKTPINPKCKLLLLTHCFEELGMFRVQLKTDENNLRSRKAIEKIGGQFEGILRNDMIKDNGTKRNSAYYSIIEEEWKDKKQALVKLYETKSHSSEA